MKNHIKQFGTVFKLFGPKALKLRIIKGASCTARTEFTWTRLEC